MSSIKFQQLRNALIFDKSPDKSWSFTSILLWFSGTENNNNLLLEINLVRWKPPDMHILMTCFTSFLGESKSSIHLRNHLNKICDKEHLILLPQKLLHFARLSCARHSWTAGWRCCTKKHVHTLHSHEAPYLYHDFPTQEFQKWLLILWNLHLMIHCFYICHEGNFFFKKSF